MILIADFSIAQLLNIVAIILAPYLVRAIVAYPLFLITYFLNRGFLIFIFSLRFLHGGQLAHSLSICVDSLKRLSKRLG